MEKSGFFNAMKKGDTWDRVYKAENFAEYFATFIGNGVFPNPAKQLQVLETDRMQVIIKAGKAWINGFIYINTEDLILDVDVADGVLHRVDKIVLRYDFAEREIRAHVKKGQYRSEPVAPEVTRNADTYELALADIKVNAGTIKITQADIKDLRLNKNLCGIVHGTVDQVDTTAIFNQFQSWYSQTKDNYDKDIAKWTTEKKQAFDTWYKTNTTAFLKQFNDWYGTNTTKWESDFDSWFITIKGALDGDIAAKLTNKTIELEEKIKTLNGTGEIKEKVNKEEFDTFQKENESHLADYMYQIPVIVGTQIRLNKLSNTNRLFFKLSSDLSGGAITISTDGGTTSKPLQDIGGTVVTNLEKAFVEVVADANFFILRNKGISTTQKQVLIDIVNVAEANQSTIKSNIVSTLNARTGTSLTSNNSWIDIINTIPNAITWKKHASGSGQFNSIVTVNGLRFIPSLVILKASQFITVYQKDKFYGLKGGSWRYWDYFGANLNTSNTVWTYLGDLGDGLSKITSDGFSLPLIGINGIMTVTWIAIG